MCASFVRRSVDEAASEYLRDLLDAVDAENGGEGNGLAPIRVEGDGFCMTHAVSRAIFGSEARACRRGVPVAWKHPAWCRRR
jgi:hypothetical protein